LARVGSARLEPWLNARHVFLARCFFDHGLLAVEEATRKAIATLPKELMRSIISDQGSKRDHLPQLENPSAVARVVIDALIENARSTK
jgi:hypothetical protein